MTQHLSDFRDVWGFLSSDRGLAYVAVLVGIAGILRADWLFHRLYEREKHIREALLREAQTVLVSYAAFSRSLQGVELREEDLRKDGAFALLTCFRIQQLLFPNAAPEEREAVRKTTREQVEKGAREYAEMMLKAGMGRLKKGVDFNSELRT